MFSFWQRLNAIFFFALSALGFLSFLGAGMAYWHVSSPRIELTLEKVLLRKIYGAGHDQAVLTLGIDADLRSVWNWNVKQLFVYVTAEYETKPNVLNQVVVWDTIISDSPSAWIRSSQTVNKYALTDQVPSTGLLTLSHGWSDIHEVTLAEEYS